MQSSIEWEIDIIRDDLQHIITLGNKIAHFQGLYDLSQNRMLNSCHMQFATYLASLTSACPSMSPIECAFQ